MLPQRLQLQSTLEGPGTIGKTVSRPQRRAEKATVAAVRDLRRPQQALPRPVFLIFRLSLQCLRFLGLHRFPPCHKCQYQHSNLHHAAIWVPLLQLEEVDHPTIHKAPSSPQYRKKIRMLTPHTHRATSSQLIGATVHRSTTWALGLRKRRNQTRIVVVEVRDRMTITMRVR